MKQKERKEITEADVVEAEFSEKTDVIKRDITGKRKTIKTRQWLLIALGSASIGAGALFFMLWNNSKDNPFFGIIAIGLILYGGYLNYKQIVFQDSAVIVVNGEIAGKTEKVTVANSLNIYGRKLTVDGKEKTVADRVLFEWVDKPLGQVQQCINTGKYYYIHFFDLERQELAPFGLPDAKYVDPAMMARYLEIPSQRRYLKYNNSMAKYIGYGILGLLVGAGFIALIAMG